MGGKNGSKTFQKYAKCVFRLILMLVRPAIMVILSHHSTSAQTPGMINQPGTPESGETARARAGVAYGKLPLSFEANRGQTDPRVKFLSRGPGYSLFLTSTEAVLTLRNADRGSRNDKDLYDPKSAVLRMTISGAHADAQITGLDELPGKSNYFKGSDPEKWVADVPTYAKVMYRDIYRGVDLIYYGKGRQLEYDFLVAPHVDPTVIKLSSRRAQRWK